MTAPAAKRAGDDIEIKAGKLREASAREWLIRFGFGAGVSAIAGAVSALAGPRVGGIFLAAPAILLASLTLVAKEEGVRRARDEARGATYGTLGLLAFALVVTVLADSAPLWVALLAATGAWTAVALAGYFIARRLGAGGDEPPA